ncbi:MAG: hypothetical protein AB7U38_14555 [Hyphomicrobiales bacterium]
MPVPAIAPGRGFRAEYAAFGAFVLVLLSCFFFVPWSDFGAYHGAAQNRKFGVMGMRNQAQNPARRIVLWKAEVAYSRDGGVLEVDIANKYDEPLDGVLVRADITSEAGGYAGGAVLERQADGRFRSGRLDLGSGQWLVGITASRRSDLMFRLEQLVKVE